MSRERDNREGEDGRGHRPEEAASAAAVVEREGPYAGRFDLGEASLRSHTARGVVINSAFQIGLAGLMLFRRVAVAAFLTTSEYGIWGLLVATLLTLSWLKEVGISDKYIQQDEGDQIQAFHRAFSLELIYSVLLFLLIVAALPLYGLVVYDRPEIILPGAILALSLVATAFQAPIWIAYRQLRFVRQRTLQSVDPVVTTAITIGLAVAGAGYWSLVIGGLVGSVVGALIATASSPFGLKFTFDLASARSYVRFSGPLLLASVSSLVVVQGAVIVGNYTVGLAGIGAIGLAASFSALADRVDSMIRMTIYPAVCAIQDQVERMHEVFVKSNRVALMWGVPFGVALALFAQDLVSFALGEKWQIAVPLIQAFGLIVALRQVGFSWSTFMRATGRTRPIAVSGIVAVLAFLTVTGPLMVVIGLDGYIVGMAVATVVDLVLRSHYLRQLFPGFQLLRHLLRSILPVLPAVALILTTHLLTSAGERSGLQALAELACYLVAVVAATWYLERPLVREMLGYLRPGRGQPPGEALSPAGGPAT